MLRENERLCTQESANVVSPCALNLEFFMGKQTKHSCSMYD